MKDRDFRQLFEKSRVPDCPRKGLNQWYNIVVGMKELLLEMREEGKFPPESQGAWDPDLSHLSLALTDMSVDLAHGGLLWNAVETYNLAQFHSPLPMIWADGDPALETFDPRRFQFFLFTTWGLFDIQAYMAPRDARLEEIATEIAEFLAAELEVSTPPPTVNAYLQKANHSS